MKPALRRLFKKRPPTNESPMEGGEKPKRRLRLRLRKLKAGPVPGAEAGTSLTAEESLVDTTHEATSPAAASTSVEVEDQPSPATSSASAEAEDLPCLIHSQLSEAQSRPLEYPSVVSSSTTVASPTAPPLPAMSLPQSSNSNSFSGAQNTRVGALEVVTAGGDVVHRNTQFILNVNSPILSFGGTLAERGKVGDPNASGLVSSA
ncbi:hypothetical protein NMY22_g6823 [Coprinellus aureogranulatus]|nr:hypothetical protein NMY22_g6823 [Coprinellus aureogranulatus]